MKYKYTHISVYLRRNSDLDRFGKFKSIESIILNEAKIAPSLAIENLFMWPQSPFNRTPCVPGSFCAFPAPDLEAAIFSPKTSCFLFVGNHSLNYNRNNINAHFTLWFIYIGFQEVFNIPFTRIYFSAAEFFRLV